MEVQYKSTARYNLMSRSNPCVVTTLQAFVGHYPQQKIKQKIIVKFVRREIKEKFYKSRRRLSGKRTKDLGYEVENRIYLGESLTEVNTALFRLGLKFKKNNQYKYIWTSNGEIYLRKDHE